MQLSDFGDDTLKLKTLQGIRELGVREDSRLLLGLSGGIDSMSLALILQELCEEGAFRQLECLHVNHGLRGSESEDDAQFLEVIQAESGLSIDIVIRATLKRHRDTRESVELAARNDRYEEFAEAAIKNQSTHVLTAHTADDQVETVLMNFLRGAGSRGLSGIPREREIVHGISLIRPWLEIWRKEIAAFATRWEIPYTDDSTNNSLEFFRNRVRHTIIPFLNREVQHRNLKRTIHTLSIVMRSERAALERAAKIQFGILKRPLPPSVLIRSIVALDREAFLASDEGLWHLIVGFALEELDSPRKSLSAAGTERFAKFLRGDSAKMELGKNIEVAKLVGLLTVELLGTTEPLHVEISYLNGWAVESDAGTIHGEVVPTAPIEKASDRAYFDAGLLEREGLVIRNWEEGDRMHPFGMNGTKLVSDLLNEAGIHGVRQKRRMPIVIAAGSKEILWVPGVRASERFRVTSQTIRMLQLLLARTQT